MKVMSILGTRPDLIKMSEIIKKLDAHTEHVFVHTGQNHDHELHAVFFKDMGTRKPDYFLGVAGNTLGQTLSRLMEEAESVLQAENPDAVVILGDTNSSLASIIAKRRKIPLFHLEAGNRCFDDNAPEEVNRRIIDHISDVNMVFSENARRNLLEEGVANERIFLMGSPMKEVLSAQERKISKSPALKKLGLKKHKYYLVSLHRDENTAIVTNFINLINAINMLAEGTNSPVVFSVHPRIAKQLKNLPVHKNIILHAPFGFSDYCSLQKHATCVISDSGTVSEESALLNFPAVTIRNTFERQEAIDAGSIIVTGTDPEHIIHCVSVARAPNACPKEYLADNCSERVLRAILSYTKYIQRYVYHV